MNSDEYPLIPETEIQSAILALEQAGWRVTREEKRFVDGSPRPLFRVEVPGQVEMVKGASIPFRKLWDFQLQEFAKERGKQSS